MKTLTAAEVTRIGQLASMIEHQRFPTSFYCPDLFADARGISAELRRIVGLPPEPAPWPELAANAEPISKEDTTCT